MTTPVGDDDLMAWVDGRLPSERHAIVERFLTEHPEERARLATQAAQRRALSDLLNPIAAEPIPAAMRIDAIRQHRRRPAWVGAAAAALLLFAGFGGGWIGREYTMPARAGIGALASEAEDNFRVFAADPVQAVDMGPERRPEFVRLLSVRLGSRVDAPDLSTSGYAFAGGRLVATPHGPAALFLYRSASGKPLGVFVRPMEIDKNVAMRTHETNGVGGVSWSRRGMGYSLATSGAPDSLNGIARTIMAKSI